MFPFVRRIKDVFLASRQPAFKAMMDTHVSHHICWPLDLDFWLEMNNGWALSLSDLGRTAMAQRSGLIAALRQRGWGMTMAGTSTRFRRRIHGFEHFDMRSRTGRPYRAASRCVQ